MKTLFFLMVSASLGLAACGGDDDGAAPPVSADVSDASGDSASVDVAPVDVAPVDVTPGDVAPGDSASVDVNPGDSTSGCDDVFLDCGENGFSRTPHTTPGTSTV